MVLHLIGNLIILTAFIFLVIMLAVKLEIYGEVKRFLWKFRLVRWVYRLFNKGLLSKSGQKIVGKMSLDYGRSGAEDGSVPRANATKIQKYDFEKERDYEPADLGMSINEARAVLGINKNYTRSDVKKSYYSLMQRNHPDQGGSEAKAAEINKARDVMMRELGEL